MKFTVGQERVFKIIDRLIDDGICVWEEIQRNETFRRRINRNFPPSEGRSKVKNALYLYGFNDFTYMPNPLELDRCYDVSESGVFLNEEQFNTLLAISNLSEDNLFLLIKSRKDFAMLEYLDILISNGFMPTHNQIKHELPEVFSTVRKYFEKADEFYPCFGIDRRIILYGNRSKMSYFMAFGNIFEDLVRRYIFPQYPYQVEYKDCRVDFIVDGVWVDVKLSKGTALTAADKTIEKYFNYTNYMKIIYALEDGSDVSFYEDYGLIKFINVREFFNNISAEGRKEFTELIAAVNEFKEESRENE